MRLYISVYLIQTKSIIMCWEKDGIEDPILDPKMDLRSNIPLIIGASLYMVLLPAEGGVSNARA